MVKGLDIFQKHFENYTDHFVLIGGTACDLAMEEAGLSFRATKDIDIVLTIEILNDNFIKRFWDFIKSGKYKNHQKSSGKTCFYRFFDPENADYPYMLEIFSRKPENIILTSNTVLTPIPAEEELSSLSAILLEENYYHFLKHGIEIKNGQKIGTELIVFNNINMKDGRDYGYYSYVDERYLPHAVSNDGSYSYEYNNNGNMIKKIPLNVPEGIRLYLAMDEEIEGTTPDTSGYSNNGLIKGQAELTTSGKYNSALLFFLSSI